MDAIRDNIPVATIMRAYLDEGTETIVTDDIKEEILYEDIKPEETIENCVPENVNLSLDKEKIEHPPQNEQEQTQEPLTLSQVPSHVTENTDPVNSNSVRFSESPDATHTTFIEDDNNNENEGDDENILPKNFNMENILNSGPDAGLNLQSIDIGAAQL